MPTPPNVPPDSFTSELDPTSAPQFTWLRILGLAALLVLVVFIVRFFFSPATTRTDRQINALEQRATANVEYARSAEQAVSRQQWKAALNSLDQAQSRQVTLSRDLSDLTGLLNELPTSDSGKRLAVNADLVTQFRAIHDSERIDATELGTLTEQLSELRGIVEKTLANEQLVINLDERFKQQVETLSERFKQAAISTRQQLETLKVVITAAKTKTVAPSDTTLADAIQSQQQHENESYLQELARARATMKQEFDQQRQSQQLEMDRQLEQVRLEQEAAQGALEVQKAQEGVRQLKEEAEQLAADIAAQKARAEQLAKFEQALPEIRSLLSPMISKGRMQLGGTTGWTPGEEGPVSLSALKAAKALDLSDKGVYYIGPLFCGPNCGNDRPRGSFPASISYSKAEIHRAQELLVEFGDILVEKEMLRP
jgi:hypothetical protein